MERRLIGPLSPVRRRPGAAARRPHRPSRPHGRVRSAENRAAPRRDARAHRVDRRHFGRSRRRQGHNEREARLHGTARGHRGPCDRDRAVAVGRPVSKAAASKTSKPVRKHPGKPAGKRTKVAGAGASERDIDEAAARVLALARKRGWLIATAESCTGGLVAGALTEIAGSSDVFERGFVTYSDAAKQALLGVSAATLRRDGAVSQTTAEEMARGALARQAGRPRAFRGGGTRRAAAACQEAVWSDRAARDASQIGGRGPRHARDAGGWRSALSPAVHVDPVRPRLEGIG